MSGLPKRREPAIANVPYDVERVRADIHHRIHKLEPK